MNVGNHTSNVATGIARFGIAPTLLNVGDVILEGLIPIPSIRFVERVNLPSLGDDNVGMRQNEFSNAFAVREAAHTIAQRHDQTGGTRIQTISGRYQIVAPLQRLL